MTPLQMNKAPTSTLVNRFAEAHVSPAEIAAFCENQQQCLTGQKKIMPTSLK